MKPGFWKSTLEMRCPRCNRGKLFYRPLLSFHFSEMEDRCRVCGQDFKIEDGFFLGAMYVSYAITVAITVPLMLILYLGLGLDYFPVMGILVAVLIILLPWIVRISRAAWFNFFVHYDPEWERKRVEDLLND